MAERNPPRREPGGAGWGAVIERVDEAWQRLEARLCAAVLIAEIASLTLWVSLKALSTDLAPGGTAAGVVFRCIVTGAFLGTTAYQMMRQHGPALQRTTAAVAVALGFAGGRLWAHAGVGWSSNALNWLQDASVLMLVGGLRGLATRLTLWLALLGASLATSRARHIHVDVLARFLPSKLRVPTAIAGSLAAAAVCAAGVVGFVDYISIARYRVRGVEPCADDARKSCETAPAEKIAMLRRVTSSDFFLLGRQISLDCQSLPNVIAGRAYDQWMTAQAWNAWLDSADWTAHFDRAAVDALRLDSSSPNAHRAPQVAVPGAGEARGVLIRELDFVFPFGLAVIAVKLILRGLLVISGRAERDVEAGP